jgi:hypothetical protein
MMQDADVRDSVLGVRTYEQIWKLQRRQKSRFMTPSLVQQITTIAMSVGVEAASHTSSRVFFRTSKPTANGLAMITSVNVQSFFFSYF